MIDFVQHCMQLCCFLLSGLSCLYNKGGGVFFVFFFSGKLSVDFMKMM